MSVGTTVSLKLDAIAVGVRLGVHVSVNSAVSLGKGVVGGTVSVSTISVGVAVSIESRISVAVGMKVSEGIGSVGMGDVVSKTVGVSSSVLAWIVAARALGETCINIPSIAMPNSNTLAPDRPNTNACGNFDIVFV